MNIVKIYSKEQLDDLDFDYCWSENFKVKIPNDLKMQIEDALRRLVQKNSWENGFEKQGLIGIRVYDKSAKVWFKEHDVEKEVVARKAIMELDKLISKNWSTPDGVIDEEKMITVPLDS